MKKVYLFLLASVSFIFLIACTNAKAAKTDTQSVKSTFVKERREKDKLRTLTYDLNGVKFKMILVKHGEFIMGSNNKKVDFSESPAHKVILTKDYLIGETEVTEALWNAVMGKKGGSNYHPKTDVTWQQAHQFTIKLNKIAHKKKMIPANANFHLPTEAQWEFAAKGGNLSKGYKYSGSNNINEVAVTDENSHSDQPQNMKTKKPNELGIYDMSGNAYEWTADSGYSYTSSVQVDPVHRQNSKIHVKRGGSNYHHFATEPYLFTTTGRYFYDTTDWTIGFRLCLY